MSIKTINLSYSIATSAESPHGGISNTDSLIRVGWEDVPLYPDPLFKPFYYNSWFRFAVGLMPKVLSRNILSATLVTPKWDSSKQLTVAIHQILQPIYPSFPATNNNPNWTRYDNAHNWSVAGGTGNGTDRVATPWITLSSSSPVVGNSFEFPLNLDFFDQILSNDLNFGVYTTSPQPPNFTNARAFGEDYFYIRVTYRKSGLAGDVTIF